MARLSRLRRLLGAAFVLWLVLPAAHAAAHPQGLPGIVRTTVKGAAVDLEWVLAGDDDAALRKHAGDVQAYFLANFFIEGCALESAADKAGAVLAARFVCERPPKALHVRSTLLLDLDRSYRTLLTVDTGRATERRFLGESQQTASVPVAGDVQRAEDVADSELEGMPSLERRFVGLLDRKLTVGAFVAGLAGALVVGAAHAVSPGHGKSVAAAYLVGSQGKPAHALLLGGVVAAMHTGSVLALGLSTWFATESVDPGRVLDWLRLATAVAVLVVGVYLVVTRTRAWRHDRAHAHGRHDHTHEHDPGPSPFSRKGLVALGLSGGLLPSPAALVVLLAGLSADRLPMALALVGAFSIGLAAAVAGAGLAVLKGRDLIELRSASVIPLAAAYAILLVGVVLTVRAAAA